MTDTALKAELIAALPRIRKALAALDKAQRVTAQHLLMEVGPTDAGFAVRAGEQCPLCGQRRRKTYKERCHD